VLTINEGSSIFLGHRLSINVVGSARLVAQGTEADPISFDTSVVNGDAGEANHWGSIYFNTVKRASVAGSPPETALEVDSASGSLLEWCVLSNGGWEAATLWFAKGNAAILNSTVTGSFTHGITYKQESAQGITTALVIDSTIADNADGGIVFDSASVIGLGYRSSVVATSSISGNGGAGIYVFRDATLSTGYSYKQLELIIYGNTISNNGNNAIGDTVPGGIRVRDGAALSRNVKIVRNVIENNAGSMVAYGSNGDIGSAIKLVLQGVSSQQTPNGLPSTGYGTDFGTALIADNVIKGNSASRYPALALDTNKCARTASCNHESVGYVIRNNIIAENDLVGVGSLGPGQFFMNLVRVPEDSIFEGNTVANNTGNSNAALYITSGGVSGQAVLHATHNTFSNPDYEYEMFVGILWHSDTFVDARFCFWGANNVHNENVAGRVYDVDDDYNRAKVVWKMYRGSETNDGDDDDDDDVADAESANTVLGTISANTEWDGTVDPIRVIGPITVTSTAVLTIKEGSSVLLDNRMSIIIVDQARLLAQGTPSSTITFHASVESESSGWGSIYFNSQKRSSVSGSALDGDLIVDTSSGSVLDWCELSNGGWPAESTVEAFRGFPAILNSTIKDSFSSGIAVNNDDYPQTTAILIDSTVSNSKHSGIKFLGSKGLGNLPHTIVHSTIEGSGAAGIHIFNDVSQSTRQYQLMEVSIIGNTITNNGESVQNGGGIRLADGEQLYRPIRIIGNVISNNSVTINTNTNGAAIVLNLAGFQTRGTVYANQLTAAAYRDGFGTCIIEGNTIEHNTAGNLPALSLLSASSKSSISTNHPAVGFIVTDNVIKGNVATATSNYANRAIIQMQANGYFERNTVANNARTGNADAVFKIVQGGGPYPNVLHAQNNSFFNNTDFDYSMKAVATTSSPADHYVDAQQCYWGTDDVAEIAETVWDRTDSGLCVPILHKPFLSNPHWIPPPAEDLLVRYWSGEISEDTTWLNTQEHYVTAPLSVAAASTLTIEPGTTIFFQEGAAITVNGQLHAIGNETHQINFTKSESTDRWGGLIFSSTKRASASGEPPDEDLQWSNANTGSALIWCSLEYGGDTSVGSVEGTVSVLLHAPFIQNTRISNSHSDGVAFHFDMHNNAGAMLDSSEVVNNARFGISFYADTYGIGTMSHTISNSNISGNAQAGIFVEDDTLRNKAALFLVAGNTIAANGHNSGLNGGGIRVADGKQLYRLVKIINNIIDGNTAPNAPYGAGIAVSLGGQRATTSLQDNAFENEFGTCLIVGNIITNNVGKTYAGLYASTSKSEVSISRNHDSVGYLIRDNTIQANEATSDANGACIAMIPNEGEFTGNTVNGNAGNVGGALCIGHQLGGSRPNILNLQENVFSNPGLLYELKEAASFQMDEYVDARYCSWGAGVNTTAAVDARIFDVADDESKGKVVSRLFYDVDGDLADFALDGKAVALGTLSSSESWDGTVHVIGPVTVAHNAVLTVNPNAVILVDPMLSINVVGRLNAIGTEAEPIRFGASAVEAGESGRAAGWGSLLFDSNFASSTTGLPPHEDVVVVNQYGSTLEWCVIEHAGHTVAALWGKSGAPAVINSTIQNSFASGFRVENNDNYGGRAILLNSRIIRNAHSGVEFVGSAGMGYFNHVLFRNAITGNGGAGVALLEDALQAYGGRSYADMMLSIVENAISGNGAGAWSTCGGITMPSSSTELCRPARIIGNHIAGNICTPATAYGALGSALSLNLDRAQALRSDVIPAVTTALIEDDFGTILIEDNTIEENVGVAYPALMLKTTKCGNANSYTCSFDAIGYVIKNNIIRNNTAISNGVVMMPNEGVFEGNTVESNHDDDMGNGVALYVGLGGGVQPNILRATNNTFANPELAHEVYNSNDFHNSDFVDARFCFWGEDNNDNEKIGGRVYDVDDNNERAKVVWKLYRGSEVSDDDDDVADTESANTVLGTISANTEWDGTVDPIRVIGPITVRSYAVLTIKEGSSVLLDHRMSISMLDLSRFVAKGTAENPISFASSVTSGSGEEAKEDGFWHWGSLFFDSSRTSTASGSAPNDAVTVSSSGGSIIEWCTLSNGGWASGTVWSVRGAPAIINSSISLSFSNAVYLETDKSRTIILDSQLVKNAARGVAMYEGLGPTNHVIARTNISDNGGAAVYIHEDKMQSTSKEYKELELNIAECTLTHNSHGIVLRKSSSSYLYRRVTIVQNTISFNVHAEMAAPGAAIALKLGGAPTPSNSAFTSTMESNAFEGTFGTCLIEGNLIEENQAPSGSALYLEEAKCSSTSPLSKCAHDSVGYVVRNNRIINNGGTFSGSPIRLVAEGYFSGNMISGSTCEGSCPNGGTMTIFHSSSVGNDVLHAQNNTFANPAYDVEIYVVANFQPNEYVDVRNCYWGDNVSSLADVEDRVHHTVDNSASRLVLLDPFRDAPFDGGWLDAGGGSSESAVTTTASSETGGTPPTTAEGTPSTSSTTQTTVSTTTATISSTKVTETTATTTTSTVSTRLYLLLNCSISRLFSKNYLKRVCVCSQAAIGF
jgi:hypothetical protein